MTLAEIAEKMERAKRDLRVDRELAESVPLLSGFAKEDISHVRLEDAITRTKVEANRRMVTLVARSRKAS